MTRDDQITAAKALVRSSYTQGRYTGDEALRGPLLDLALALRELEPTGGINQAQAAELLASGAPVLSLRTAVVDASGGPEAA